MRIARYRILGALVCALAIAGCASTSGKQRVVAAYQGTQTALAAFQDTERALYQSKVVAELTPARHAAISDVLATAFGVQAKVGDALLIWKSGQPAPAAVGEWLVEVDRVLTEIERLTPSEPRSKLLAQVLSWARTVMNVARLVGALVPPRLEAIAQGGAK